MEIFDNAINKLIFPWKRYWLKDGSRYYDDFTKGGFLTLPSPEHRQYYPARPTHLEDLIETPVLILLGEPGYGKSQALRDEEKRLIECQPNDLVTFFDLKTAVPGDEKQLLDEEKLRLGMMQFSKYLFGRDGNIPPFQSC